MEEKKLEESRDSEQILFLDSLVKNHLLCRR